jgi:SCY1-like protein 1
MTTQQFLDAGMLSGIGGSEGGGWFKDNKLVKICAELEGFGLANSSQKLAFISMLKASMPALPPPFARNKILPVLVDALNYKPDPNSASGMIGAAEILPLVLQIGKGVEDDAEYKKLIIQPIVKLYSSPDRGLRLALLDSMELYIGRVGKSEAASIWNDLVSIHFSSLLHFLFSLLSLVVLWYLL